MPATTTNRSSLPLAAEQILNGYFPVLDHGFIALKDVMGSDEAIEEAARLSYQAGTRKTSETRGLLRYLLRNRHTTPFEMVELKFHVSMPIFVARQWVRHRTACLSGDTVLHFDRPSAVFEGGASLQKLTIAEVFERFQPTENRMRPDKQRNPYHRRDRVKGMFLRSVNEDSGEVYHTRIKDVWQSGVKQTYAVRLADRRTVVMSEDHLCLTDSGWKKLKDIDPRADKLACIKPASGNAIVPEFPAMMDYRSEEWRPVPGYEGRYWISSFGRVQSCVTRAGNITDTKTFKKPTVRDGRAVIGLSKGGVTHTVHIHKLILYAFVGPKPDGQECRHLNGNALDNRLDNLAWGTSQENSADAVRLGTTTPLSRMFVAIDSITPDSVQMTYDLEVEGPYNNFSANGVVVHNSINEVSGRYSLLPMLFYTPAREDFKLQSKDNKQGRGTATSDDLYDRSAANWQWLRHQSQSTYEFLAGNDVARELARIDLPLSTYTQWYWKIDLHNLFNFLRLRVHPHAQKEIRVYAEKMAGMVARVAPLAYEAWLDYEVGAERMSRMEMEILRSLLQSAYVFKDTSADRGDSAEREVYVTSRWPKGTGWAAPTLADKFGLSKREVEDFHAKLQHRGIPDFSLDLTQMRDAQHFADLMAAATPQVDR